MSAAEATGRPTFSPYAPGGRPGGTRPSPRARAAEAPPLRVVPPPADATTTPTPEATAEPRARRIDWAAAGTRTTSVGATLYRDLTTAWVWRDVPPALRAIWQQAGQPPIAHPLLNIGWRMWMYGIALPATAVGYTTVWLHQHPLRGAATYTIAAASAAAIWIF